MGNNGKSRGSVRRNEATSGKENKKMHCIYSRALSAELSTNSSFGSCALVHLIKAWKMIQLE